MLTQHRYDEEEPDGEKANVSERQSQSARLLSIGPVASKVRADLQGAIALHQRGQWTDAERIYREILEVAPDHFEATHLLGAALVQRRQLIEAERLLAKALEIKPNNPIVLHNRGVALQELTRFEEALASYDKAIRLKPDFAGAFYNRGNCLQKLRRIEAALASYEKAIALKPDHAEAFNNLGLIYQELKRFDEALASYDKAIMLSPRFAEFLINRALALQELNRLDEALASYDKAISLKPDFADGFRNRALCRLLTSRCKEGWIDYEWRWESKDFPSKRPDIKLPTWQGEDLLGRHLLVFSEQGLGDAIQFARYLPLLAERKARITFLAPAKLARLLRPSMKPVEIVSTLNNVQGIDFQVALMSLPHRFNTDLPSIPNKAPYLKAEPELEVRWKDRIGAHGFKIGIAWQGNPGAKIDEGRSIPLELFVPLSRLSGVRLISLQKHVGLDQLANLPKDIEIETLGDDFDSGPDAFIDTAAAMNSLDLIISADTSIVHLAGALARPAWVALRHVPNWRWFLDRQDSPWYPTLRLFRQPQRDDWMSVFAKIERELYALLGAKGTEKNPLSKTTPKVQSSWAGAYRYDDYP
jgi:tetratricopeptide (TPR) repeat protein